MNIRRIYNNDEIFLFPPMYHKITSNKIRKFPFIYNLFIFLHINEWIRNKRGSSQDDASPLNHLYIHRIHMKKKRHKQANEELMNLMLKFVKSKNQFMHYL